MFTEDQRGQVLLRDENVSPGNRPPEVVAGAGLAGVILGTLVTKKNRLEVRD